MAEKTKVIVPGGLNTDIIGLGVPDIVSKGELSFGGTLKIGPGGKSRNIAQMISMLMEDKEVAMIGKTSKDPFGLWRPPVEALIDNGVDVTHVKVLEFSVANKYPGIALIPVDKRGNNQIYVLPGINEDFREKDIDEADELFQSAKKNNGILALSLELPLETAVYALNKANGYGIRCALDPGGMIKGLNYDPLFENGLYLIKPNEHEIKMLTGISIDDEYSAKKAAEALLIKGVKNVLITLGEKGAYLFSKTEEKKFDIPTQISGEVKDETGCGDQTIATIVAYLSKGYDLVKAVEMGIRSGTMQFYREGIDPVKKEDLAEYE